MYRYFGVFLLVLTISLKCVIGVDYCDKNLCRKHNSNGGVYYAPHIGCNNKGEFGGNCPTNAKVEILSTVLRSSILNEHNKFRNILASGQTPGYMPASRMLPLKWNQQLADLALLNAKTCIAGHDSCRNTPAFKYSGQNIFRQSGNHVLNLNEHLVAGVGNWYSEFKNANMAIIDKWAQSTPSASHFTQMCSDRQNYVGCGTVRWSAGGRNYLKTTCNYASTNIVGKTVYKSGPSASKCTTGRSLQYTSLCSEQEVIDPNVI